MNSEREVRRGGKVVREVTLEAVDMSEGMTAGEMLDALLQVPPSLVPVVEIKLNGKIKRLKFKIEVVPNGR